MSIPFKKKNFLNLECASDGKSLPFHYTNFDIYNKIPSSKTSNPVTSSTCSKTRARGTTCIQVHARQIINPDLRGLSRVPAGYQKFLLPMQPVGDHSQI